MRYRSAFSFKGGVAIVEDEDGEMLLIDKEGTEICSAVFRSDFTGDLAIVENENKKKGFINRHGKVVIPYQYDDVIPFREGYAAVALNNKWGFINEQGVLVIPLRYDAALVFNEGLGLVMHFIK